MANTRSLNVQITGDVNPSFTRAMAKADKSAGDLSVRFGAVSGSIGEMLPVLARAAPALVAVGVAGTSVASSLAAAAGGASALGVGLAASLAPMLVVGKQVTSRFEEVKKAYEAVQTAQREGTAEARKNADEALALLSKNERAMVGSLGRLAGLQQKVLGGASDGVFVGLSKAIDVLAPRLEKLAPLFDKLGRVIGGNIGRVGEALARGPWQDALKAFVDSSNKIVGPITTIFLRIGNIVRDVAVTALPYVQEAFRGLADWFADLDEKATRSRIREIVGDLVKHTRSWFDLFKEIGKLAGQVFGASADTGRSLVDTMTAGVAALNGFVAQMRDGTGPGGKFAGVLGSIRDVAVALWPALREGGAFALGLLRTGFERAKTIIEAVTPTVLRVKDAISGWVQDNGPRIAEIASAVRDRLGEAIGWLQANVPPAFEAVKGAVVTAFEAVKGAISSAVTFVRGWIDKHRDDINAFGQAWQNIGSAVAVAVGGLVTVLKAAFEHVLVPAMKVVLAVVKAVWPGIKMIIEGALENIGGIINVFSGLFTGDFGRMWDGIKGIFKGSLRALVGLVRGAAEGLFAAAKGLGGMLKDGVVAGVKGLASLLKDAIVAAVEFAAKTVPALIGKALGGLGKAITAGIKAGFDKLNPFGDGLGDGVGFIAGGGGGTAALMGADSDLFPIVQTAGRFGLRTTSGLRPGSITSSGNRSYHSSGDAVDEAGSPGAMLKFFNYMKSTAGGRLRELIYTPGGVGIKDGRPFRYTGQVAADHFDHVHVAYTGPFGDGIGQIRNLWTREGGSASTANMAAAVAMAESGGSPSASHRNSDGSIDRGLWQINSVHGGLSTFDRAGNARAAIRISGNGRNWNPWTVFKTGAYKRFLSGGSSDSGGSSSKTKNIKAPGPTSDAADGVPRERPAGQRTRIVAGVRVPVDDDGFLGGFNPNSIKGVNPGAPPATDPEAGPSEFDYLDLALANAEATAGTSDDVSALTAIRDFRARALTAASATGDPRLIATARRDLTGAENTLINLTEALKANTEAIDLQRKQYEAIIAEDYRTKFNVSQSQYGILAQAVAEAANGGIGQRLGLSLSGLRAPAGAVSRL